MRAVDKLERQIGDEISVWTEAILSGRAQDYAEYRNLLGRINGLEWARETLIATRQEADRLENEE